MARKKWTCSPASRLASRPCGARGEREPLLPAGVDLVVAHVRRVADVEGGPLQPVDGGGAVVGRQHRRPPGQPGGRQVGAAEGRRQRVELHGHEPRRAEAPPGRDREAPRSGAGVDHAAGRPLAGGPGDHRIDDRGRRVGRTVGAPQLGRAQPAEGLAQRVAPPRRSRRAAPARPPAARAPGRARGRAPSPRGDHPGTSRAPRARAAAEEVRLRGERSRGGVGRRHARECMAVGGRPGRPSRA